MSRSLIFTYNIRRSLFEQNLDHYSQHLKRYNYQSNIYFLPIVNNLGDGIEARAKNISKILPRLLEKHNIHTCNLVSFSLSGIDARFALRHLGLSKYVHALTTIGTPHLGSRLAWMS
jgi:triacylglycerol esterase/lipase EstA (alpha/beta hydrolase family)